VAVEALFAFETGVGGEGFERVHGLWFWSVGSDK